MSILSNQVNFTLRYIIAILILVLVIVLSLSIFRIIDYSVIPNFLFCVIWFYLYYEVLPLIFIISYGLFIDILYGNIVGLYGWLFFLIYIIIQKITPSRQQDTLLIITIKFSINFLFFEIVLYYIKYSNLIISYELLIKHIVFTIAIFPIIYEVLNRSYFKKRGNKSVVL